MTGQEATSEGADDDSFNLWYMKLEHTSKKSLQTLARQRLLKGAKTCKLEFCEHCVIGKKTKVKFGTAIHHAKGILDYVHTDVWGPVRLHHLDVITTLCRVLMIILGVIECTPYDT